jgi:hypothetical protein
MNDVYLLQPRRPMKVNNFYFYFYFLFFSSAFFLFGNFLDPLPKLFLV